MAFRMAIIFYIGRKIARLINRQQIGKVFI